MAVQGIFYVHIQTPDLARSKAFYGETLGWKLNTDQPGVAGFWFGDAYLVITEDQRPQGERTYGGGMSVEAKVDDLDAEHARLTAAGVQVTPIQAHPWGERNFMFHDPDHYRWSYGQQT